ncbi:uncharacterized protein LOC144770585 isoform X2 [Lissotriton helveticus]
MRSKWEDQGSYQDRGLEAGKQFTCASGTGNQRFILEVRILRQNRSIYEKLIKAWHRLETKYIPDFKPRFIHSQQIIIKEKRNITISVSIYGTTSIALHGIFCDLFFFTLYYPF